MQVSFNPHVPSQAANARGPQSQTQSTPPAPTAPAPTGAPTGDGVEITLSDEAQEIIKNHNSPAFLAREYLAGAGEGAAAEGSSSAHDGPFGQTVRTFTYGHMKKVEPATEGVENVGEVTEPIEPTGDEGEVPVVEEETEGTETAPSLFVEEPDITEIFEDDPVGEEEVVNEEPDEPIEEALPFEADDPTILTDTGDIVEDFLDLFDEGTEGVV